MRLSKRIQDAELTPEQARTLMDCMHSVAQADGVVHDAEVKLITRLLTDIAVDSDDPAPLDELWGQAELILTACVYVAVADGHYTVEEARLISDFAHQLGFSAVRLRQLESRVFHELRERGKHKIS